MNYTFQTEAVSYVGLEKTTVLRGRAQKGYLRLERVDVGVFNFECYDEPNNDGISRVLVDKHLLCPHRISG